MSKKQQQQAADAAMDMDELNLDDLFLGGDGDGAMGGLGAGMMGGTGGGGLGGAIAASLFADMDLDLGYIMDGIMGMDEQTSSVSTDDGGGGGRVGGYGSNSMRGMMMLDDDFMGGSVDFDDGSSASVSVAGGKASRRRSSTNSIYSAGREVGGGGDTTAAGSNRQRKGKRTRTARSNPHQSTAVMARPQQHRLQQSREVASLAGPSPSPTSATGAKSRRGDLSSLIVHSNRTKEAKIVHQRNHSQSHQHLQQQPLQGVFQPSTSSFQLNRNSNEKHQPQSQASGPIAERKRQDELGSSQLRKAEKELSNFGLPSSRTLFFPFMKLPTNLLDCKNQRSQKSSYPILEKLSVQLAPSVSSKRDEGGLVDSTGATTASIVDKPQVPLATTSSMPSPLSSNNTIPATHSKSLITVSSPIYSLFQHTQSTSPSKLIEVLMNSTDAVESTLRQLAKKRKKKNIIEQSSIVHHSSSSPQSPPPPSPSSSSSSSSQLVEELVKIYLSHLKQSAFLRQNAINMENWCNDHFTNEDTRSIFPVDRKSVEEVCNLVWMHDNERILSKHQQQLEEEGRGVGGRCRGAGTGAKSTSVSPIIISVEVKVKLTGWREKPGTILNARLACPKRWKVAMARGASTTSTVAVTPPLDLSTFSRKTLVMVSEEILRFDVLPPPPKKSSCAPVASAPCSAIEIVTNDTVSESTKDNKVSVLDSGSGTPNMIDIVDVKAKRRRKTKKDDVRSASPRSRGSPTIASPEKNVAVQLFSSSSVSKSSVLIPHIPGTNNPRVHRRKLHNETPGVDDGKTNNKTVGVLQKEGKRIVHALYNSILGPAIKPSKRRALLAEEVSWTLSRINQQTASASQLSQPLSSSLSNTTRDQISKQIVDSQAAYLDDVELIPTTCGMWKCLENANYFEVIEKEEDVSFALESLWQPETMEVDEVVNEDGGYYYWGSLPQKQIAVPMDNKADMVEVAEESVTDQTKTEGKESSPLFDHLQSLLVEVEDHDGVNNDNDDEDDDYLIANLPPYSPEEFVFGPNRGNASYVEESVIISTSDTDTDDYDDGNNSAMFDQSNLTLDQRTYIQLRAARLVDCKWRSSHRISSSMPTSADALSSSGDSSPHTTAITESTEVGDDEPVDDIVRKMKHRLSNLRDETNAQVAQLHRLAVANVAKS